MWCKFVISYFSVYLFSLNSYLRYITMTDNNTCDYLSNVLSSGSRMSAIFTYFQNICVILNFSPAACVFSIPFVWSVSLFCILSIRLKKKRRLTKLVSRSLAKGWNIKKARLITYPCYTPCMWTEKQVIYGRCCLY